MRRPGITVRFEGRASPDADGDPPYPDVAGWKGKSQALKDLSIAFCEDYNPHNGDFTHAAVKPAKDMLKIALDLVIELQTIIDYDANYGLPR